MPELAPGIWGVTLPLPFELNHINIYLVRLPDGLLMIDTGMQAIETLESGLREAGAQWRDVRLLLLTHMHPDHTGLATEVLRRSGARLLMHREDAHHLNEIAAPRAPAWLDAALHDAGVPKRRIEEIQRAFREVNKSFHPLEPDWLLEGGESFGPLQFLWTPGHSPGHVCVYDQEQRVLFSGDHILEHITPNIGWHHGRDALGDYLESLGRIAPLEIDLVLPSHGGPFSDHRARIAAIRRHHDERCAAILGHLGRPKTAHELALDLWGDNLAPFNYRFAVFEVLAHLEYLGRRGSVTGERAGDCVYWKNTETRLQPLTSELSA